jgi:hypothetical protein
MNLKRNGRKSPQPDRGTCILIRHTPGGNKKHHEPTVAGNPVEIRNEFQPNMTLELCGSVNRVGKLTL